MSLTTLTPITSTLVARATPPGMGAVAIIRLSGPDAWKIAAALMEKAPKAFKPRYAHHCWLIDKQQGALVDEVLLLPFKAPASFTGEDVVEIHAHGGVAVVQQILTLCLREGAVMAGAGDFTRRAYLNGKLKLTQAEAIADLIHAEGTALARLASHNLKACSLNQALESLRTGLITIQAEIVASVDYPEEVEEPPRTELITLINALQQKSEAMMEASKRNRFAREGFPVALLGQPNAGKSSLFNALLSLDRSIVTDAAGTTRDVVGETFWIEGVAVYLQDTAGLREASDKAEQLGVERSWQAAHSAEAVLYLLEAPAFEGLAEGVFPAEDQALLSQLPASVPRLILANKTDLLRSPLQRKDVLPLSVKTGEGLQAIYLWLEQLIKSESVTPIGTSASELLLSLNQRQLSCMQDMSQHLNAAVEALQQQHLPLDIVTIPLTDALLELDTLQGRDTREEVLDDVFSRFCVGK